MLFLRICSQLLDLEVERSALSGPALRDAARLSQRYRPIARHGVFGVSTWPIGCDTPSPFSERFPLGEHAKWRCDTPPPKRGISAILAQYSMKTRQTGAIPPSAILSRKGVIGEVSRIGPLRFCDATECDEGFTCMRTGVFHCLADPSSSVPPKSQGT